MTAAVAVLVLAVAGCGVKDDGLAPGIYIFSAGLHDGALGGRSGADALAAAALPEELAGREAHALISVSASDCIANMPGTYGFSADLPVMGVNGVQIAENWADLLDDTIDHTLAEAIPELAGGSTNYWWSGSLRDGQVYDEGTCCDGWTSNDASVIGAIGDVTSVGGPDNYAWIDYAFDHGNISCWVIGFAVVP